LTVIGIDVPTILTEFYKEVEKSYDDTTDEKRQWNLDACIVFVGYMIDKPDRMVGLFYKRGWLTPSFVWYNLFTKVEKE